MQKSISQARSEHPRRFRRLRFAGVISVLFYALAASCGVSYDHEEFSHRDPYMTEDDFKRDMRECEVEKKKHSSKIQGREFGFKGEEAGFLGCMKVKGWDKVTP